MKRYICIFLFLLGLCFAHASENQQLIQANALLKNNSNRTPKALGAILPTLSRELGGGETSFYTQALHLYLGEQNTFELISESELVSYYKRLGYLKPPVCKTAWCFKDQSKLLGTDFMVTNWLVKRGDSLFVEVEVWNQNLPNNPKRTFSRSLYYFGRQDLLNLAHDVAMDIGGFEDEVYSSNQQEFKAKYWEWAAVMGFGAAALGGLVWGVVKVQNHSSESHLDTLSYINTSRGLSSIRGFFANSQVQSRSIAMGQSGVAGVNDAWSVWTNPAGSIHLNQSEMGVAKEVHAGIDRLALVFGGPLGKAFSHAEGAYIEGDSLALESRFTSSFSTDLGLWSQYMHGLKAGLSGSTYIVQAGKQGCEGIDCSKGDGLGFGIDVGVQWSLSDEVTLGVLAKDIINNIRYQNELTGLTYHQDLPPEIWLGSMLKENQFGALFMADYRLGVSEDQSDRIQLGAELPFWSVFRVRGGWNKSLNSPNSDVWSTGGGIKTHYGTSQFELNLHWTWADLEYLDSQRGFDFKVSF